MDGALLITGASGFLGSSVLKRLLSKPRHSHIYVAGRRTDFQLQSGLLSWRLDISEERLCIPKGVETVLHIAGEKSIYSRMNEVNHLGTERLARAACDANVRRFVYVSSVGSYGAIPYSGRIDESHLHTPRNEYEQSKDNGETAVRLLSKQYGMTVAVLQPTNVIGLRATSANFPLLGLMRMIVKRWFTWFGHANAWVNYVSVDDVADSVLTAARIAHSDTFIINTPAKLVDVVGWVCDELGCPIPERRIPLALGSAAAVLGSSLQDFSGWNFPLNKERFLEMTNTNWYNPARFMHAMQYEYPMGIEQLIRSLARTYRQRGLL
jgi:nucleoside-diphosphate-sugar epimerase